MKKVFLTLTMLLFAFMGTMKAQEVTLGSGTTTNGYLPTYEYYNYSLTQQIYTADELGQDGTITSIAFYATSSVTRNLDVYMVHTTKTAFESTTDWIVPTAADKIFSGNFIPTANAWTTITLATPFEYNGTDNLAIIVDDNSGTWVTSASYYVYNAAGNQAIRIYSDDTNYNPLAPTSYTGTLMTVKNQIKLNFFVLGDPEIVATPDVLDLGYRPIGAWMAPATISLTNAGNAAVVSEITTDNNFYVTDVEVPFTLTYFDEEPFTFEVNTGTAEEGLQEGNVVVVYAGNRSATVIPISATAYNPVEADVVETAYVVEDFPFSEPAPDGIYHNYEISGSNPDAADAVYQVTFDQDVLLTGGTSGANGAAAIYTEDFYGENGPMATNNYTGPEIGPGPSTKWFSYNFTGSNTWYGTSAGGGMMWGYMIPAATLQELGLGNFAIATVESAARNSAIATYYDLVILKGGDTPDIENMVYYQEFDGFTPGYYFDINLNQLQSLGDDENIWIMLYSDSEYAAYCGQYPEDATNGKVWYSLDLTNWYSNSTYTPEIYTKFIELPGGREITMNLADMKVREFKAGNGEMAEATGDVKGIAKAKTTQNNRGNRDVQNVLEEGFEGGSMPTGWTVEGSGSWTVGSGDYSTSTGSATGTYNALITHSSTGNDTYLVTPQMDLSAASTAYLTCNFINRSWAGDTDGFGIYYRVNGGAWNELYSTTTAHSTWTSTGQIDLEGLAANYQIGFMMHDNYGYGVGLDDVVLTADISGTPVPPASADQFSQMFVSAGTYYVVVSSTDDNFPVELTTEEVPVPEPVEVRSPYDTQTGVSVPWLVEYTLGNYTSEMQVLFGTVYPPTTPLVNWTSDLVESFFLTEIQHNKTYFIQINERNSAGITYGDIIGFTTVIDGVEGFTAEATELYPGDEAVFTWEANRSIKGYNLYQDGVKVNETPITGTTYSVADLAYNMTGYEFQLTAVYDEGESAPTDAILVQMTGNGTVSGHVWEVDSITPVYNVAIQFRGTDEYGHEQVIDIADHTNPSGFYQGEILAGNFVAYGTKDAYAESASAEFTLAYEGEVVDNDIIMLEYAAPLGMIKATEEENDVLVEWSWNPASLIVDFETGDFSQAEFNLNGTNPWIVTTTNPYEGTYCMKSTCEGIASGTSVIEATVDVPYDGKMGFYVRVSSESSYDKFHFYIDGIEQGQALSGQLAYTLKEFDVSEGTHIYKWEYSKDSSVNSNDDCVYVDNITMYRLDVPVPPTPGAQVFNFDDSSLQGWTTLDADGDGYSWYVGSEIMATGYGHNGSTDCVLSQSYDNNYGVLYPDNYLVSPTKIAAQAGASISFYACAQDASYAGEHFGVAVSTGAATAANFTTIQEWTMTAKGTQGRTEESEYDIRGTRDQGSWYQYTVDLSSYAGQEIWVALRHFNCSDMFYLDVDDITINDGSAKRVENNRQLMGYNLYRRNMYGEGDTTLIATPAIDVMSYIDNEWNSLPFGIYSWGIQARYEGNHHYPEKGDRGTIVIDFETGDFSQYDFSNTSSYPWTIVSDNGSNVMKSSNSGVASSTSTISATVNYVSDGTVSFDALCQGEGTSTFWDHCDFAIDGTVMLTCGANVAGWNNYNYPVTAGEHTFTWSYTKDSSVNPTGDFMEVDNITFDGVAGSSAAGGANDSEILWSNEIEKDMEANVTFNIVLNNDQSPVGATIEMVGPETYEGVFEADTLVIEGVRKGAYDVTVELAGYESVSTELLIEADGEYDIFLEEVLEVVDNLYVSPTGWAMWETSAATSGPTAGSGSSIGGHTGGPTPPTPPGGSTTFTEGFEGGLNGWQQIKVNADGGEWLYNQDNLGGYDYSTLAHTGSGFAMCYSFVDYVGSFDTDCYLYTPQKYSIVNGSTLTFWADNANDDYPESFSVCVATADNPTASDFTQVWGGSAKGTSKGDAVRHINNRYENWRQHTIDLSAYAGQDVYIAFHDVNYDMYEVWIDDVVLDVESKGERAALVYKVKLDGEYLGETPYLFYQHDVDGFEEGETHITEVAPVYASGMGEWASYEWTYVPCDGFVGATNVTAVENEEGTAVEISWTMPEGGVTPPPSGTPAEWYYYDNGTNEDAIGTGGGNFWWGVMFPAGSYVGTKVFKTAAYDYMAMTGTVTIYNDGTTAPATAVGTANVTLTGSEDFVEVEFAEPVNIDPSKNLWVVYYNGSAATYPAAVCSNTGDANGRWVSLDGATWEDLAGYGLDYTFMIRAFVGDTERGEVHEITVPQYAAGTGTFSNAGVAKRGNRDAWDLVYQFSGNSAGQQAVATDGTYIYTASWQSEPTGGYTFYQYGLDGTFIEGFNIAGATGIRDLTTDGEYFYGTSGGAQIFILDFTTRTLVGTINCSGLTSRHISYDPVRDGFWAGNWTTLALYSRSGSLIQNGPAPTSAYGSAYYKDADDVEHLYLFCQISPEGGSATTNRVEVIDYNITTGSLVSGPVHICNDLAGYDPESIAGGCFIGTYDSKTCFFANVQQSPNLIGIYELEATSGPVPPTPVEGILGSVLLRDGEVIAIFTDELAGTNSYVDDLMEIGEHEYCVRVIYGGEPDETLWAMSCPDCATVNYTGVVENDVVENIYPNPTHDQVTIEAAGMNHITVVNTLGQVVYDADVNADMIQLSLGQYKAGLYLVRINTQNGVSVKRVTVVK